MRSAAGALAVLLLLAGTAAGKVVVVSDGTFSSSDWNWGSPVILEQSGGRPGEPPTESNSPAGSGGSPGAYRQIQLDLPARNTGSDPVTKIVVAYLRTSSSYDPSGGEILSIDYGEDNVRFSADGQGARFAIEQDGGYWSVNLPNVTSGTWQTATLTGLAAGDFNPEGSTTGSPDFSSAGAPITFGFIRWNSNLNIGDLGGSDITTQTGIDDFTVTIYATPEPAGLVTFGLALVAGALLHRRRRRAA